ncbi:MAG: glycosyl hydrolase [Bacteroidales bacterium]
MNKNQFILRLLSVCVSVLCFFGCGSDGSEKEVQLVAPRLTGSTLPDGSVEVVPPKTTIVLTFDQNVNTPAAYHSLVSIKEGGMVEKITSDLKNATITLNGLEKGRQYELIIPKGVIFGPTKVSVEEIRISFKTQSVDESKPLDLSLCTENPMSQTKKVYDYLLEIYGKKVLSGSMANVNWNIAEAELVYQATGKYPAIAFFDYIHLFASGENSWIDYSKTQVVEDWWNNGGLIGAGWHWNVPVSENSDKVTYRPEETDFRTENATIEGTWENKVVQADLLKISECIKLLQVKQIPVIWRPLHEAAGNIYEFNGGKAWFWWGAAGAEAYRKLWIYMFEYFKKEGINNLIWVWTTQGHDDAFYPGDEYVDIIGRDIYDQKNGIKIADQYQSIASDYSQKLVALSECGSVAKISEQWNADARWSFFMPWYQYNAETLENHEHADAEWWKDAMLQEYVITRADLPSMK